MEEEVEEEENNGRLLPADRDNTTLMDDEDILDYINRAV
jgi:hypothetical protein